LYFFERWKKTALLVFSALAFVWEKPNVLFVRWAFSVCCPTSLYMARSVQIMKIFSDVARAEFFNFSYYIFSISQIKKFGGLANIP